MSGSDTEVTKTTTRQRIIEAAQLNCYEARSQCSRFKDIASVHHVPREHRLHFQHAILDYYYALRPLRNESPVEDWWQDVELSTEWTERVETPVTVEGAIDERLRLRAPQTEERTITGLDAIERLDELTETITDERETIRGLTTSKHTRQRVLPFPALKDIASVLDDAAGRLGFAPTTPTPDETDPDPI